MSDLEMRTSDEREWMVAARAGVRFASGAAAVLTAHQAAVWALHEAGAVPWTAYALAPTRPLGVPQVLSAAFWGGVWWVALAPVVEGAATRPGYWVRAAALGAVLPTSVGAMLMAAGQGAPRGTARPGVLLASGLAVNALWGLAAAAALLTLSRPRSRL